MDDGKQAPDQLKDVEEMLDQTSQRVAHNIISKMTALVKWDLCLRW